MEFEYCEGYLQDNYFVQGWLLTDKGRETELFKQVLEEAQKQIEKMFG